MLLKNARVLAGSGLVERDVLIEGGRIAKVRPAIVCAGHERIDCSGLVALPGLMDIHAHLREPGQVEKEDFLSGSRAALAGGYTVVWDMPNNMPKPTCTKEALEGKRKLAGRAECEVRFHFGADGRNFNEIRAARPESLKMYLGETTGNLLLQDEGAIEKHMRQFPRQSPVFVHAEGKWIRKAVGIARRLGRKVHITHAPRAADVETAKSWKLGSVDCTPHHLFLHSSDFLEGDWRGNVKPPLQSRNQVEKLWGVLDKVDAIGTDHAPHLVKDKEKGAYGFPGLETSLALFLDAYSKGRVGLKWIQERFCENPARIMGMTGYGKLERGFVGDVALVDLNCEWEVRAGDMKSKAKWSPWEGRGLRGRVVKTIFRGKIAYEI